MTIMQERAFDMIKQMPDDKLYYVLQLLEGIEGLAAQESAREASAEQMAYADLQRFRKSSDTEIDYKAELEKAREEKCAGIN